MAITIIKDFTSNKFYPSQNPINTTVSSNNSGKCNFRYICDLYINGTKVFSDKLFPDPNTGYAFFQLSRVIQDYIKTSIPKEEYLNILEPAATTTAPSAAFSVYCKFGEEYDSSVDCDGTINQYTNLKTSNTFYVYEAAFDYKDFPSYVDSKYLTTTGSTTYFLTNSPRETTLTYNDSYYLDFITVTNTNNFVININVYDTTGSLTGLTYSRTLTGYKRYRLAIGPFDINTYYNDTKINMTTNYYEVYMSYGGQKITETFTFKVKDPKPFRTRIGFVGLLGGLEHFTFYHRNRTSYAIDRKNYEKLLQSNYSNDWKYEVGDRGTTTYAISARENHTVASYCDIDTSAWLHEMWLSPQVWTYDRPDLLSFRAIQDGTAVKFWVDNIGGLSVGDDVFCFSNSSAFNDRFTITAISGNIISLGLLYSVYGADMPACGYIHKVDTWSMLPIVISDNMVEVKQKAGKAIEYQLNYSMANIKNTLRG